MRSTDLLVKQYSSNGHELGRGLEQQEAVTLIEPLRQRLHVDGNELDLSPASLKQLEKLLIAYHERLGSHNIELADDKLVQFVREIAAYLGLILIAHAGGKWDNTNRLWASSVVIPGPIRVIDGKSSYTSAYPMIIFIGHTAGASWELIERGIKPVLYSTFLAAQRKISKQNLRPEK